MAGQQLDFNTPVGRFVSGDLVEFQTKNFQGHDIPADKQRRQVGVAISKTAPGIDALLGQIYNHGLSHYASKPGGQTAYANAQKWLTPGSNFSWKIKDGDAPLQDGTFNENTKGCWVFYFSTRLEIKGAKFENGTTTQIDPSTIKRGWYVDVFGSCAANDSIDNTAGMYLNPAVVRVVGYGPEITGGVNVTQAFANSPAPVLPAGASTMPVAGSPIPPTAAPQAAPAVAGSPIPPTAAPQAAQLPGFTTPAPTTNGLPATGYPTNVAPHTAFVPGAPVGLPGQ